MAQTLGDFGGTVRVGETRNDEEFLSAPAHDHVRFAEFRAQQCGELHENGIAGGMAVGVVDRLEAVDVEQEEHEIAAAGLVRAAMRAQGRLDIGTDVAAEESAIAQPGQRIGEARLLELVHGKLQVRGALTDFRIERAALRLQLAHAQAIDQVEREQDRQRNRDAKRLRLVPRGLLADRDRERLRSPVADAIAAAHLERVGARIEMGIGGDAPRRRRVDPVAVVGVEPELVAVGLRIGVIERGEADAETARLGRQLDLVRGPQRHTLDTQFGDHNWRIVVPFLQAVGIDDGDAFAAAEQHAAIAELRVGADPAHAEAEAVGLIEFVQAPVRGIDHGVDVGPDAPLLVLHDVGADRIAGHADTLAD